ncbi:hypothetical protein WDZ92_23780 [Nostoc sp. NIES-2111]
MRILMILLPNSGSGVDLAPSVLTLDAVARSFYVLRDFGAEVVLASLAGGFVPVDRPDLGETTGQDALKRFKGDHAAREALGDTVALGDVYTDDFEAALCIGSWATDKGTCRPDAVAGLVEAFKMAGKHVSMVLPDAAGATCDGGSSLQLTGAGARTPELAATILLEAVDGGGRRPPREETSA